MLESKIQAQIVKEIHNRGCYCVKTVTSLAGFPDLLAIKNGVVYFFEVKNEIGRLSPLQKTTIQRINQDHTICFVVRSLDEFIIIWDKL